VLVAHEIKTNTDLKILLNIIALNGVLLELVSVIFIGLNGYVPGTRLKVLNINENDLGLSLLMTIPGVIWWASRRSNWSPVIKKLLAGLYLLLALGLIGLSGSRGGAISLGVMLLTLLLWRSTRLWGFFVILVIGAVLIVAPSIFSTTIERFIGVQGDTALGGREYLWPAALQLIRDHLLTGVGIGNSPFQVIPYMIKNGAPWVSPSGEPLHNPVFVIFAETGFPGVILYLGALGTAISAFISKFVNTGKKRGEALSPYFELVTAMFIGFMISWIKGGGAETSFGYYLMLSLLISPSLINSNFNKEFRS
jgi:O-antigen ligase